MNALLDMNTLEGNANTNADKAEENASPLPQKNPVIRLPLKIALTEQGVSFFMSNRRRLTRVRLADNVLEYGIEVDRITAVYLQKMVTMGLVSRIELACPEFITRRSEVIDLTKLLVYSILYVRFDNCMFKILLDSDFVKQWNRTHPTRVIDSSARFNDQYLKTALHEKRNEIQELAGNILAPIVHDIRCDRSLTPRERTIKEYTAEKHLTFLRRITWYLLISQELRTSPVLLSQVRSCIREHLAKAHIAEYLALMVMELATYTETDKMTKFAKTHFRHEYIGQLFFNEEFRNRVLKRMVSKQELLYMQWRFKGSGNSITNDCKMQVTLLNKAAEYRTLKRQIENQSRINTQGRSLLDFYSQIPEEKLDTQLGLYYLSYLDEECRKRDIRLETMVNQLSQDDLTVIILSLFFK